MRGTQNHWFEVRAAYQNFKDWTSLKVPLLHVPEEQSTGCGPFGGKSALKITKSTPDRPVRILNILHHRNFHFWRSVGIPVHPRVNQGFTFPNTFHLARTHDGYGAVILAVSHFTPDPNGDIGCDTIPQTM